jgi:hypothetical protein
LPMSIKSRRPDMRTAPFWTRRGFVGAGLSLPLLAGCSSDQHSDESGLADMLGQSFEAYAHGGTVTRDQAGAVPYASIGVSVGTSSQVLLALATQSRDVRLWTSSARIAIETQSGRITRTAGLRHNMSQNAFSGSDPLLARGSWQLAPYEYLIDLPDRNIYQTRIHYEMQAPQPCDIYILGARLSVLHLRERGSCSMLGWQFENEYWADARNRFVWQSRQTIHPDLDDVEIVVLRRPA